MSRAKEGGAFVVGALVGAVAFYGVSKVAQRLKGPRGPLIAPISPIETTPAGLKDRPSPDNGPVEAKTPPQEGDLIERWNLVNIDRLVEIAEGAGKKVQVRVSPPDLGRYLTGRDLGRDMRIDEARVEVDKGRARIFGTIGFSEPVTRGRIFFETNLRNRRGNNLGVTKDDFEARHPQLLKELGRIKRSFRDVGRFVKSRLNEQLRDRGLEVKGMAIVDSDEFVLHIQNKRAPRAGAAERSQGKSEAKGPEPGKEKVSDRQRFSPMQRIALAGFVLGVIGSGVAGWTVNEVVREKESSSETVTQMQFNTFVNFVDLEVQKLNDGLSDVIKRLDEINEKLDREGLPPAPGQPKEQPKNQIEPQGAKTSGELTVDQAKEILDKADGKLDSQLTIKISKERGTGDEDTVDWALGRTVGGNRLFNPGNPSEHGQERWKQFTLPAIADQGKTPEDYHLVHDGDNIDLIIGDNLAKSFIEAKVPLVQDQPETSVPTKAQNGQGSDQSSSAPQPIEQSAARITVYPDLNNTVRIGDLINGGLLVKVVKNEENSKQNHQPIPTVSEALGPIVISTDPAGDEHPGWVDFTQVTWDSDGQKVTFREKLVGDPRGQNTKLKTDTAHVIVFVNKNTREAEYYAYAFGGQNSNEVGVQVRKFSQPKTGFDQDVQSIPNPTAKDDPIIWEAGEEAVVTTGNEVAYAIPRSVFNQVIDDSEMCPWTTEGTGHGNEIKKDDGIQDFNKDHGCKLQEVPTPTPSQTPAPTPTPTPTPPSAENQPPPSRLIPPVALPPTGGVPEPNSHLPFLPTILGAFAVASGAGLSGLAAIEVARERNKMIKALNGEQDDEDEEVPFELRS